MTLDKIFILSLTFLALGLFTSCDDDDDPVIENDEEVITTLTYTLTPASGGSNVVLSFSDLDGDGGNDPIIMGGTLAANETYTGALDLLNEAASPAESITEEVSEEDDEHQFFFETSLPGITIAYTDADGNGNPLGLSTTLSTGAAASGNLTITLRHEPDKNADGVADGNISNAGGETDIEVTFPIDVQ